MNIDLENISVSRRGRKTNLYVAALAASAIAVGCGGDELTDPSGSNTIKEVWDFVAFHRRVSINGDPIQATVPGLDERFFAPDPFEEGTPIVVTSFCPIISFRTVIEKRFVPDSMEYDLSGITGITGDRLVSKDDSIITKTLDSLTPSNYTIGLHCYITENDTLKLGSLSPTFTSRAIINFSVVEAAQSARISLNDYLDPGFASSVSGGYAYNEVQTTIGLDRLIDNTKKPLESTDAINPSTASQVTNRLRKNSS